MIYPINMTSTLGSKPTSVVIGDSDALIATLSEEDKNFLLAKAAVEKFVQDDIQVIFPITSVVEAVTTLTRKLGKPNLAAFIVEQIKEKTLSLEVVDTDLLNSALEIFDPRRSKKNTLFDAVVAATAKKYKTNVIFSFDEWYEKLGFQLAGDYLDARKVKELEEKPGKSGITLEGLKKKYKL